MVHNELSAVFEGGSVILHPRSPNWDRRLLYVMDSLRSSLPLPLVGINSVSF